ncbi:hypothetical protein PN36_24930 [Candidatus Thiomargarita nelsonii]|uniref:Uncharacterized protein n=1 Tax=Candidatus Thiomargarita nelsonii TaxID=1003181 RepID=A0A0A6P6L4_9GAMM|nr:hypothetical protein PN36_24930 [Candidatus Thiomargarita nelsonii]
MWFWRFKVRDTPEELDSFYQKLQSYKLSLLDDVKAVDWHLDWWNSEPKFLNFVKNGASTLRELSERLSDYESLLAQSRQPLDFKSVDAMYSETH